jgi:hypothetical protein
MRRRQRGRRAQCPRYGVQRQRVDNEDEEWAECCTGLSCPHHPLIPSPLLDCPGAPRWGVFFSGRREGSRNTGLQRVVVSSTMIRNAVHRIAGRALPMLCVAGILLLSLGVEASGSPQPETRKVGGREEETDTSPPFRWAQRKDRILLTIDLQVYNLPIPSLQKKKLSLSLSLCLSVSLSLSLSL